MALKSILFLLSFFGGCAASLRYPIVGVITYMSLYFLAPSYAWWANSISSLGIRYYLVAASFLAVGMVLNWGSLKARGSHLHSLEWGLLLFLAIAWLSVPLGVGGTEESWFLLDKMTKVVVFIFLMTHCVTSMDRYKAIRWLWVIGGLYLGYRSFNINPGDFVDGRISGVGGPDFKGSSGLAAHLAMTLPFIGVTFLLDQRWRTRVICLVSAGFVVNALILMRTRGAFLGVLVGVLIAVMAVPKAYRNKILACLLLATIIGYNLTDDLFLKRMSTINVEEQQTGRSTQVRLDIWKGSLDMLAAHPQGVGIGNFTNVIGDFAPGYSGRAAHNTFVRIYGDLGIHGLGIYLFILWLAARSLLRIRNLGRQYSYLQSAQLEAFALGLALIIALTAGFFTERTYVEGYWWLFAMVICLERSVQNAIAEHNAGRASEFAGGPHWPAIQPAYGPPNSSPISTGPRTFDNTGPVN